MTKNELLEHFIMEDETFIELCIANQYYGCRGCKYAYICEQIEQIQKQKSDDRRNKLSEPKRGKKVSRTETA